MPVDAVTRFWKLRGMNNILLWRRQRADANTKGSILSAISAAFALILFASACATTSSTPDVKTNSQPSHDFTGYHSFALLPFPTTDPPNHPGLMARISGPAHDAVVQALTAKGLKESDLR